MLTSDQLDVLGDPAAALYDRYQESVINDIARRLGKLDFAKPTAAWQMQRIIESGKVYENALDELSRLTGQSVETLKQIFKDAGVKSMRFDDKIYQAAGFSPTPLNLSPAMTAALEAGMRKTQGVLHNMTLTTAGGAQNAFVDAADLAYLQVSTGAMSYTQAIRDAVTSLADQGLNVVTFGGRQEQLDAAVRRAVLTGVSQTAGQLQMMRADEMGADLVETSAHAGARPSHQEWQGKVFSRSGTSRKYPDFRKSTGYGTGPGLGGWNCRHSFYPFFEGISEQAYSEAELERMGDKKVTYNGETLSLYDATQEQRYIERGIRHWKRRAGAVEAAGLDGSAETAKVKEWQGKMRDFIKQTGLQRQSERERVIKFTPK